MRTHSAHGYAIGTQRSDTFYDGSYADGMTVGNISATYQSNWVYWQNNSSSLVLGKQGYNTDYVGQVVCQSGRVSGFVCGTIQQIGFWIDYGAVTLYQQRSASYTINFGDSGAPVLANNIAFGIQSGKNSQGLAIYSHIYWVERYLGWTVQTN